MEIRGKGFKCCLSLYLIVRFIHRVQASRTDRSLLLGGNGARRERVSDGKMNDKKVSGGRMQSLLFRGTPPMPIHAVLEVDDRGPSYSVIQGSITENGLQDNGKEAKGEKERRKEEKRDQYRVIDWIHKQLLR